MAKREPTRLNMTGEDFKKLIEQHNPDGKIDTLPEMMAALKDMRDDGETIDDVVKQQMEQQAKDAYDAENRRLYIFGRKPETEEE